MPFWDKFLKRLLGESKADEGFELPEKREALVHEVLRRSPSFKQEYFQWANEGKFAEPLRRVYEAYWLKRQNVAMSWEIHLLQMPYANGFALTFPAHELGQKDFIFLFEYLKDRVLSLNYRLADASYKMYDRGEYVETIEQYHLKPRVNWGEGDGVYQQEFGNVTLELIKMDDLPAYCKVVASIYSGRQYSQARHFDEFIELLLQ
ncbi:MAG: hypothetical protein KatS3mg033_1459 [Thermonema sp.]|uniref:hypothetical protein n=1 Tax=Thermonema sp. TaxID=2231181 RepID=UPI0021DE6382|nr:hypothetical protein [Thermonema sp.]GIV39659.1 MAG: hypothetical protein KatS3mg033_1459 [Thermonema sp.]